jgi:hypothetical protein
VTFPKTSGRSGLNRNTALSFLFHEVHSGCAVVDLADFMNLTGEFENAFGGGRFARVNVGENSDVTVFTEVLHA